MSAARTVRPVCPCCGAHDDWGSSEIVRGVADINGFTRTADGEVEVEYGGSTDIDWDSQVPEVRWLTCGKCQQQFGELEVAWEEVVDADV